MTHANLRPRIGEPHVGEPNFNELSFGDLNPVAPSANDSRTGRPPSNRFSLAFASLALCVGMFAAAPVLADGSFPKMLTEQDKARLDGYQEVRQTTLDYVRAHGSPSDVKMVNAVMAGDAKKIDAAKIAGDWRCRVIKLSKQPNLPIIAYNDFRCRITDDGAGLALHKLTGSQRTNGTFYDINDNKLAYVGAVSLGDQKRVTRYGESQDSNEVGYLVPLSAKHMRLELPSPTAESNFDVLELRR
ncbi:DUF4893 domain-containing protein [Pigmentiphaga aceris]|uniref:DUF4893 domain-containing protein n=1 Tax=Pigmentiphaga aceris TaxID=1940612 RepID=UPI001652AAE5|nr:DUF4893 domain-containing protein [Pigmentiphaga aceris]